MSRRTWPQGFLYVIPTHIWILPLEFIACCQKSNSFWFSLKWFSQAQHVSEKFSLVLMWPLAILNAGLACLLFTQQHLNMCRNARLAPKAPPLLSLSLYCHDLKTRVTLWIVKLRTVVHLCLVKSTQRIGLIPLVYTKTKRKCFLF